MSTPPIALAEPVPVGESYLLVRRLAMGGVADIFLARQSGTAGFEKDIVIKRLRPELRSNARVVKMFLEEARIGALLNHPNIVHVYDVDAADGAPYIAMEYILGGELGALCRRGLAQKSFLPFPHAVELMRQAAAGLGYLHAKRGAEGQPLGLVHRDVSPSNMLVTEDGFLKLIDFGIAKSRRTDAEGERMLPGRLSYMAPEQVARRPVDPRADIFSLGVVLYELTLGRRLFKGPAHEVAKRIAAVEVEPPTFVRRDYPAALEQIVMKALAKDPEQRYQSAYDLADDLEELLHTAKLASGPVRIARYLDELGHAEGRTRRPELLGRAGSESGAEQAELFSSFRAAPGREWDDAEEPIADVASALGIDVAELRAMRVPASDLDPSGDARQIRARRATGDLSRPLPLPATAPSPGLAQKKEPAQLVDEAKPAREAAGIAPVTEVVTEVVTGLAAASGQGRASGSGPAAKQGPAQGPAQGAAKKGKDRRSDRAIKKGNKASRPTLAVPGSAEADTKPERKLDGKLVNGTVEATGPVAKQASLLVEATRPEPALPRAEEAAKREAEAALAAPQSDGRPEAIGHGQADASGDSELEGKGDGKREAALDAAGDAKAAPGAKPQAALDAAGDAKAVPGAGAKLDGKARPAADPDTTEKVERMPSKLADKALDRRPDLAVSAGRVAFGAAMLERAPSPHQRWVVIGVIAAVALLLVYLIAS